MIAGALIVAAVGFVVRIVAIVAALIRD